MKKCKLCNLEQEDSNFYKNGKYLLSNCRKCLNIKLGNFIIEGIIIYKNNLKIKIWKKEKS
jgi:hypothetical protein